MAELGPKTDITHWDTSYRRRQPRMRLPSRLRVATRDFQRLLARDITPDRRVLEIGCAPGKHLAWVASLGARVSGLDYAPAGIETTRKLFRALSIEGDLRCEDVFQTTFPEESFDLVYSVGVIEHFDDPNPLVRIHVSLLAPGGTAVIVIPDYNGFYGAIQRRFNPENLDIHNLQIMKLDALRRLAPLDLSAEVETFRFGRLQPGLVSLERKWPRPMAFVAFAGINLLGLFQPFDIDAICPWLVLRIKRRVAP